MNRLRMGGGAASLAAHRAEEIIKRLSARGQTGHEDTRKRTKNGELRLDKILKYNLGGGYRLLCVRRGRDVSLLYVGTHDDSNRWLENNRGFKPVIGQGSRKVTFEKENAEEGVSLRQEVESEMDYEDILMEKIDEKILRSVFSGLCAK